MKYYKLLLYCIIAVSLCFNIYSLFVLCEIKKAEILVNEGHYYNGLKLYDKNVFRFNDDPIIQYKYSICLFSNDEYQKAYEVLNKVLYRYPDPKVLTLQARTCIKLEKYTEAEFLLLKAAKIAPNKFEPLYWLFTLYRIKDDKVKSIEIGKYIINKKEKIKSYYIDNIKDEIASYINSNNN